jgi:putative Holliday junction resolvase
MNCLGIDYGEKRIGLAYGDDLGVAVPLPAVIEKSLEMRFGRIGEIIRQRRITQLVIGYPYNMDGSVGFKAKEVDAFVTQLEARFPLPVQRMDERLTTHQVEQQLRTMGRPTSSDRYERSLGTIDSRSAALILQDYLNLHCNPLEGDEPDWDSDED